MAVGAPRCFSIALSLLSALPRSAVLSPLSYNAGAAHGNPNFCAARNPAPTSGRKELKTRGTTFVAPLVLSCVGKKDVELD